MSLSESKRGKAINLQAESAIVITAAATLYKPFTVYVGTGGSGTSITVTTANGETGVEFKNIPSGGILPVQCIAITAATASDLIRLS